VRKIFRLQKSN